MFGAGATQAFVQQVQAKTGLYAQGDRFVGQFMGMPASMQTQMVTSAVGNMMHGGGGLGLAGALLGASGGGWGMAGAMTGSEFFMKYDYVIELQANLPGASIRESTSLANFKSYQQRGSIGHRAYSGVAWIDSRYEVCSLDPQFIQFVCAFPELQHWLPKWYQTNLSWHGRYVWLELIDSPTRISSKFGTAAMQNGDMVLWGMAVVAAAARATFAR